MQVSKLTIGALSTDQSELRQQVIRSVKGNRFMSKYKDSIAFSNTQATNNFTQTTASQQNRMLDYLGCHGSISTFEARQELAIQAPAVRKMELGEQGFLFETERRTLKSATGSVHKNVAVYHLVGFNPDKMTLVDFLRRTGRVCPLSLQFDELRDVLQAILATNGVNGHRCLGNYWGFVNLIGKPDGDSIYIGWGLYPEKAEAGEVPAYREDMLTVLDQIKQAIKRFIGVFDDGRVRVIDSLEANYCFGMSVEHGGLAGSLQFDFPAKEERYAA